MQTIKPFHALRILVLGLLLAAAAHAQQGRIPPQDDSDGWRPHTFYGGEVYLSFGSWNSIGASPMIGYTPVRNLYGGVGITYIYSWGNDFTYYVEGVPKKGSLHSNIFGGRAFLQYYIVRQIFAKTEFQYYSVTEAGDYGYEHTYSVPYLLLGGGYRQPVGGNAALELSIMFDVLNDKNSWYDSGQPIVSVGIVMGI